jgi:hypothetical protein
MSSVRRGARHDDLGLEGGVVLLGEHSPGGNGPDGPSGAPPTPPRRPGRRLGGSPDGPSGGPRIGKALLRYTLAWLAAGAVAAALLVALLDDGDELVALPPVRQIDLVAAARAAGCELREPGAAVVLNPPVKGSTPAEPASPGVYDRPPDIETLVAALQRGVIVIHYRPSLPRRRVDELRRLQGAVPDGTIVTPNGTGMEYEVAATAWRRLLGCPRLTAASVDAVRLFRGRFLASGPRSPE